jgi:hypothetical protein
MTKQILGHIDCPSCGTAKAMRITPDKNGAPFGFCEDGCGQQLRVGGNSRRVRLFVARFPWAAMPVTVTVQETAPAAAPVPPAAPAPAARAPAAAPAPVAKPAAPAAPAKVPAKARASWFTPVMGVAANG